MTDEIFSTGSNSEQVVLDAGKIVDCRARDVSLYAPGMCPSMLQDMNTLPFGQGPK